MWLKQGIEKRYLKYLVEFYSRADRRFMLKSGLQTYPSYLNPRQFHIAGYVKKAYTKNGITYIDLETSNNISMTITTPKYTNAIMLEFESVLCEYVTEHTDGIIDNTVFQRSCQKVTIL